MYKKLLGKLQLQRTIFVCLIQLNMLIWFLVNLRNTESVTEYSRVLAKIKIKEEATKSQCVYEKVDFQFLCSITWMDIIKEDKHLSISTFLMARFENIYPVYKIIDTIWRQGLNQNIPTRCYSFHLGTALRTL